MFLADEKSRTGTALISTLSSLSGKFNPLSIRFALGIISSARRNINSGETGR